MAHRGSNAAGGGTGLPESGPRQSAHSWRSLRRPAREEERRFVTSELIKASSPLVGPRDEIIDHLRWRRWRSPVSPRRRPRGRSAPGMARRSTKPSPGSPLSRATAARRYWGSPGHDRDPARDRPRHPAPPWPL